MGHMHPPPNPPSLNDVVNSWHDLENSVYATLALVGFIVLIVIGLAGCFARLICALQPDTVPEEEKETTTTKAEEAKEPAEPAEPTPMSELLPKLSHVVSTLVAGVIALAVGTVLADGTSVIRVKQPRSLPIITNPDLKDIGIDHRIDELLGPTYGIGLHHDQAGFLWTHVEAGKTAQTLVDDLGLPVIAAALPTVIATDDLKHPVAFLECKDLQTAGLAAMGLGFIAESVAVLMILFHALCLTGLVPPEKSKPLACLVWAVLSAGFLIVVMLAVGIYLATWKCDNVIIPEIKIEQHFDYNYGFAFAIIGYISSLLILFVNIFATASSAGATFSPPKKLLMKIVGALTVGMSIGAILSVAVMAGNNAFDDDDSTNPNVNPCEGQKRLHGGPGDNYFSNVACWHERVAQTLEQAGANVTKGFRGTMDAADRVGISKRYTETDLCPVNVHWHLGAEHLSVGEYDDTFDGPNKATGGLPEVSSSGSSSGSDDGYSRRELASKPIRHGGYCKQYDANNPLFTTEYKFEHCMADSSKPLAKPDMIVGETYEIHWPHSAAGDCGTKWQYQTPFYDGVFCKDGIITVAPLNTYEKVGVQAQVFILVNDGLGRDSPYYYPDLLKGMIVDRDNNRGMDMAIYTGSTTGTSRDNSVCSRYTPITWQVDRKCHMIHAASFDKLCSDMMRQADDMTEDLYAHGARHVVWQNLTANNQMSMSTGRI